MHTCMRLHHGSPGPPARPAGPTTRHPGHMQHVGSTCALHHQTLQPPCRVHVLPTQQVLDLPHIQALAPLLAAVCLLASGQLQQAAPQSCSDACQSWEGYSGEPPVLSLVWLPTSEPSI
jgi:hypothetical protein